MFEAFTEVRHLSRWWGPEGFTTTTRAFEFRVGGEWDFVMHGPDGTDYSEWISWTEITPRERVALRHEESRDDPNAFESVLTFAPDAPTAGDLTTLAELPLARPARADNPGGYDLMTTACQAAGLAARVGPTLSRPRTSLPDPLPLAGAGPCFPPASPRRTSPPSPSSRPIRVPAALALSDPTPRASALSLLTAARAGTAG